MISLRFVTCNDLISRTIRGAEMGFWASHVEAVVNDGYLGAHADGGVAIRAPGYDAGKATREAILNIESDWTHEMAFLSFLQGEVGQPYDMRAIEDMAEGTIFASAPDASQDRGWICSALIAAALNAAGLVGPLPCGKSTTPRDVFQMCCALKAVGQERVFQIAGAS